MPAKPGWIGELTCIWNLIDAFGMADLRMTAGLWAPAQDSRLKADVPTFQGLPDLDVGRTHGALEFCTSFHLALDVGAHLGATSMLLARRFERVVAFEPMPDTFEALQRNVAATPNVQPLMLAVGDRARDLEFAHNPKFGHLSHVFRPDMQPLLGAKASRVLAQAVTIDSFNFERVSFIRIDVHAFEREVIVGAMLTIARCRPVILLSMAEEESTAPELISAVDWLANLGMERIPDLLPRRGRIYHFPA